MISRKGVAVNYIEPFSSTWGRDDDKWWQNDSIATNTPYLILLGRYVAAESKDDSFLDRKNSSPNTLHDYFS